MYILWSCFCVLKLISLIKLISEFTVQWNKIQTNRLEIKVAKSMKFWQSFLHGNFSELYSDLYFIMQARENVIEDVVVIGEDDSVLAGFTAITKACDDGTTVFC